MIVESTRPSKWRHAGTLWGSRDLRDWQPYVIAGQIFIFLFMVVEFGAVIPPAIFSVAIAMFGIGVAFLAPPGMVMRIPLSLPILLYMTWYVMSTAWAFDEVWWMRIARREVPMTVAMIVVAALLPVPAIIRAIMASFYAVVVMTIAALILSPATTTRHIYPGNSQPPLPGWHGLFDHKTGMALFLLIGLITVLTFEPSALRRTVTTATVVVLIIGSQSSTGLSALVFVLVFHLWLKNYMASRGQRGSAYVLGSIVVGVAAVFLMWAYMPAVLEARGKDLTLSGRTLIWSSSVDAIRDRPLTGYGIGGVWRDAATDPTAVMLRKIGFTVFHSHSTVLEVMLLLGAIGLVLFLLVYVSAVSGAIKALAHDAALARWALLILGVQFVLSLSEVAAFGPWLPLMAAICVLTTQANRATPAGSPAPVPAPTSELARR